MQDKEQLVKEHRLIEATSRNYTGMEGKFGFILKTLGEPIISQTSQSYCVTKFVDVYDLPDEETMPTADVEMISDEIGKMFSGLKYGANLEIRYLKFGTILDIDATYKTVEKVLDVSYDGELVYREIEHNLDVFKPNELWETAVERLYALAKKKAKKIDTKALAIHEKKLEQLNLLERLRAKWGI